MYRGESWTIKKAECRRIDAFELWCWGRLLRVPWTTRRSNQSILKEISPEYSLEGLMLKWNSNTLATWCEELTHLKRLWCWERLKAGGEGDDRGWDGWMASLTQWTWVWASSRSWQWTRRPGVVACGRKESESTEQLNWTESKSEKFFFFLISLTKPNQMKHLTQYSLGLMALEVTDRNKSLREYHFNSQINFHKCVSKCNALREKKIIEQSRKWGVLNRSNQTRKDRQCGYQNGDRI